MPVCLYGSLQQCMHRTEQLAQARENRLGSLEHCQAEDLGRQNVAVTIYDKSRQTVGLGVNNPAGVRDRIEPQNVAPQLNCPVEPCDPEIRIGRRATEIQHSHGNFGPRVVKSMSQKFALRRVNRHKIPRTRGGIDLVNQLEHTENRYDVIVNGEVVASYDVLTMVSEQPVN